MKPFPELPLPTANSNDPAPALEAHTQRHLGRQLQALYGPVLDDTLDPRLSALQQLESDQSKAHGS